MQRVFERFRNEAELLAMESNTEVEIVVKYSFKGKPETSSVLLNEHSRYGIKTHEVPHNKSSQKPLIKVWYNYVKIRNPGSRPPPLSTKSKKKIREPKNRSPAQSSSNETLTVRINAISRRAKRSQSMISCVIGRFVDGRFESAEVQNKSENALSKDINKNENYFSISRKKVPNDMSDI
ncbi:unnamed protein product [Brugia timori]|uniref:HTH_48 domain-containing protein n=1 Tax=Brugia timori TaxID=42155 RepID=A0A0R3Q439_9BILA|nr:unnamed protein product [Brugia timori]